MTPTMLARTNSLWSRVSSRLSRETSSGAFIAEIDGLRFVAIALVVLYHATFWVAPQAPRIYRALASHGNFGVQLFFVISGFVLALPFARHHLGLDGEKPKRVSLRRYFVRRLTRLEPPYLINLFFWFWIKVLVLKKSLVVLLPHLAASVFYSHNWIYRAPSEVNFFAWSLEVEVQFYLLAPALAAIFLVRARAIRRAILASIILALSAQRLAVVGVQQAFQYLTFPGQAEWFLVGLLLVDIYLVDWRQKPKMSPSWNFVGVASWIGIFVALAFRDSPSRVAPSLSLALPWLVLLSYVAVFRAPLLNRAVRVPAIYTLGGMCYSIYLYHGYVVVVVMKLLQRFFSPTNYGVDTVIGLIAVGGSVSVVSSIAFVLFEKPFMRPDWPSALRLRARRIFGSARA